LERCSLFSSSPLSLSPSKYAVQTADALALPGFRNDLFIIDPVNKISTDISRACHGKPPTPRNYFGYTVSGGKFYVMGGLYDAG
jgi:hypothetical protein